MSQDIMIRVENVGKVYRLGAIGGTTLREDLSRFGAKLLGKEDPTLRIGQKARKKSERFQALSHLNFDIRRGEAVGIIGHNGAGKSTLLKLITRVTAPSSGRICLNGRVASMLEVGTGFHPELTGRENIYMNGAILGMTKAEIDAKLEEIIDFSEVRPFIDTPVKRYSSGMYVKLAFAVAAHLDSEIVIMDEVLAVGDMAFQNKCLKKMREAADREGRTVLYVSHNMNTIRRLCDRCLVLEKGAIVFDGNVEEAIAIYMNQNSDTETAYDYTDRKRPAGLSGHLTLLSAEILDQHNKQVIQSEPLRFSLHGEAKQDIKDIGLRFELFGLDGSVVGTTFSDRSCSAQQGQTLTLTCSLPTEHLAPSRFRAAIVAYQLDRFGNPITVDRVDPAFSFEVLPSPESPFTWLTNGWGQVRLGDTVLTEN